MFLVVLHYVYYGDIYFDIGVEYGFGGQKNMFVLYRKHYDGGNLYSIIVLLFLHLFVWEYSTIKITCSFLDYIYRRLLLALVKLMFNCCSIEICVCKHILFEIGAPIMQSRIFSNDTHHCWYQSFILIFHIDKFLIRIDRE